MEYFGVRGYQAWRYAGRAGETLQISVSADIPCYGAAADTPCLDTRLTVLAPHGELLTVYWPNGNLMPGADDIEYKVNSNSQVSGLVLPYDGDYSIEVSGSHFKTGGAYTLTIESQLPESIIPTLGP